MIGKVLLGIAVLRVHGRIMEEHRIDGDVLRTMRREKIIAGLAIAFIIAGYLLEMWHFKAVGVLFQ